MLGALDLLELTLRLRLGGHCLACPNSLSVLHRLRSERLSARMALRGSGYPAWPSLPGFETRAQTIWSMPIALLLECAPRSLKSIQPSLKHLHAGRRVFHSLGTEHAFPIAARHDLSFDYAVERLAEGRRDRVGRNARLSLQLDDLMAGPIQFACRELAAVRPTSSVAIMGTGRSSGCR